ncbi:glutaredoxin 3 [Arctopsyche grandis]|uniref:glutaredoxin 3 n=1 Tax=Arctopsyche grandis TaxID=121162 RepID=UPI00406D62EA
MSSPRQLQSATEVQQAANSNKLSVIHFEADWAPQCKQVTDALIELAKLPEIQSNETGFYVCPAEQLPDIALKYKVEAVPTVILLKNNQVVDRIDGVDIAKLTAKVKSHTCDGSAPIATEPLEERLKKLINKHNIMVFMKGNRDMPRCGFSKTLIQILQDIGVEYETFDILTDEEVRQGLKTFSDWPTYPQVYAKGELLGGLDIIKEMQACGELETTLKS